MVYAAAKARAAKLGIDFGELVERSLERDLKERMAILRTEEGVIYAPLASPASLPATGKVETFVMNDPKDKQAGSNPPIKKQKNQ